MDEQDVRWKQRFQNLEKSLSFLELAIKIENPDIIQKAGLIQFFEISFELSWNVLKDYLEDQGFFELRSPRDTIKKAFQVGLITDGHLWIQALQNRNLTAHTYDEKMADQVADEIRLVYYPLIQEIYTKLKSML